MGFTPSLPLDAATWLVNGPPAQSTWTLPNLHQAGISISTSNITSTRVSPGPALPHSLSIRTSARPHKAGQKRNVSEAHGPRTFLQAISVKQDEYYSASGSATVRGLHHSQRSRLEDYTPQLPTDKLLSHVQQC